MFEYLQFSVWGFNLFAMFLWRSPHFREKAANQSFQMGNSNHLHHRHSMANCRKQMDLERRTSKHIA